LLKAEAMSVAMMTTVVTHAVKRGPRTSTCCGPVILFDTRILLLVVKEWFGCKPPGLLRVRREERARLLSSYDNNSNNPRRGTDRLRGAW
jgi:hypothetical protein